MRLQWFEIQGYKNIHDSLRMDELGRVNVLHGDNNVGKSNLLESIGLLFVLLQAIREDVRGDVSRAERFARRAKPEEMTSTSTTVFNTVRSFSYLTREGFPPGEIFNLREARPISIRTNVYLEPGELEEGDPPWLTSPIELGLSLERREDELLLSLTSLLRAEGTRMVRVEEEAIERVLERLGRRRRGRELEPRFALVRADRTIVGEPVPEVEAPSPLSTREPLPPELGLALYDAENATEPLPRQRFERFRSTLARFEDILGEGQWRMFYDRREERAELFFETAGGATRVPLRLMGSGVQQIVCLIARLVMTGADIVAIEEPELNLRYKAQLRLREILSDLVAGQQGLSQLLLTSHSPAFEMEEMFYALKRSPDGPRVERRPRSEARLFTQPEVEVPPEGARAPLSYVTTDGLVLVPEEVRKTLGLEHGGGVVFIQEKDTGHYRMLTDDQFLDVLEPREPSP